MSNQNPIIEQFAHLTSLALSSRTAGTDAALQGFRDEADEHLLDSAALAQDAGWLAGCHGLDMAAPAFLR